MSSRRLPVLPASPVALIVAHPGHELRIWRWLEILRPEVSVVTNGAGRDGVSRIETTGRLIDEVGAQRGRIFGQLSDGELYHAVLAGDSRLFVNLAECLADDLTRLRVRTVLGDAAEGIIMAHDLLREVRRVATALAERRLGWEIAHFEFPLDSHPAASSAVASARPRQLQLTSEQLARKLSVASRYKEIATLIQANLASYGVEAFGVECLFPCVDESPADSFAVNDESARPRYEIEGENLVRQGRYAEVIRYRTHVLPLVEAVRSLAWSTA